MQHDEPAPLLDDELPTPMMRRLDARDAALVALMDMGADRYTAMRTVSAIARHVDIYGPATSETR